MFGDTRSTRVAIDGDGFTINGSPTYEGATFETDDVEGLLLNSRMVQALFDDENPETVEYWRYPDTGEWGPERNVREFVDAMPTWYDHGLRAVTINLQCGNPAGYAGAQPWDVSGFRPDGSLKDDWLDRLELVLDAADDLGMVVILGYFYFGADQVLADEASVFDAAENATEWLLDREYTNVLVEVNNECDVPKYDHDVLKPGRVDELVELVKSKTRGGFRYPASTSFGGGTVPADSVVDVADYLLVHGNGIDDPDGVGELVRRTRDRPSYEQMPVVFNEDDHYDFRKRPNNMQVALANRASWGFLDIGRSNYRDGYQSPPVSWDVDARRKREFFEYVEYVTSPDTP